MVINRESDSLEDRHGERFMRLYSSHQQRLYLYTVTLLPRLADAEDVFQEANMVLWRKFDAYQAGTNFFAWACQIIRFEVLKHYEKRSRAAQLFDPDVLDSLTQTTLEQAEYFDEFHRRALGDCIDRLASRDRDLLQQRYNDAVAVQRIAASMNRSPNAISKSLGRIRRLLLDCVTATEQGDSEGQRS